jgi:hypothetical protein
LAFIFCSILLFSTACGDNTALNNDNSYSNKNNANSRKLCILKNKPVLDSRNKRNITLVTTRRSPILSHHQEEFYEELNNDEISDLELFENESGSYETLSS